MGSSWAVRVELDGRMDGGKDGGREGRRPGWVDGWMDGWINGCINAPHLVACSILLCGLQVTRESGNGCGVAIALFQQPQQMIDLCATQHEGNIL
eukprot:152240-Chlamydomonas_euryale.AAC.1